jgi:hypothetical protein
MQFISARDESSEQASTEAAYGATGLTPKLVTNSASQKALAMPARGLAGQNPIFG